MPFVPGMAQNVLSVGKDVVSFIGLSIAFFFIDLRNIWYIVRIPMK